MPTKQKSGLYRARVKIGVDANGKDVYKYISGRTKKELEQRRQEVISRYITGTALNSDRLFGEYAQEWFTLRIKPKLSASSIESYRVALNKYILPRFGDHNLRAVRPLDLQLFLDGFAGKSATSITYIYATLRKIYRAAITDRLVTIDPTASIVKPDAKPAEEKRPLTPRERAIIANVCATNENAIYLALLYYLGVRSGEACGLQWGDVNWQTRTIHVCRDIDYKAGGQEGSVKTPKSVRDVPIPQPLYEILSKRREMPGTYIVPGPSPSLPITKAMLRQSWMEMMVLCGFVVPAKKGNKYAPWHLASQWEATITPHYLRHNYITMLWERDFDVYTTARIVGHSNINTTLKIYTHLTEQKYNSAAHRIDDMFAETAAFDPAEHDSNVTTLHGK